MWCIRHVNIWLRDCWCLLRFLLPYPPVLLYLLPWKKCSNSLIFYKRLQTCDLCHMSNKPTTKPIHLQPAYCNSCTDWLAFIPCYQAEGASNSPQVSVGCVGSPTLCTASELSTGRENEMQYLIPLKSTGFDNLLLFNCQLPSQHGNSDHHDCMFYIQQIICH